MYKVEILSVGRPARTYTLGLYETAYMVGSHTYTVANLLGADRQCVDDGGRVIREIDEMVSIVISQMPAIPSLPDICEELPGLVSALLDELDRGSGGERRHAFNRERLFYLARVVGQSFEMQEEALRLAIQQRDINAREVDRLMRDCDALARECLKAEEQRDELLTACEMHTHLLRGHSPSVDEAMERAIAKCLVEEGQ